MTARIYKARRGSLDAIIRAARGLDYVARRQLVCAVACMLLETPPIYDGHVADPIDVAANLHADIDAILCGQRSLSGSSAAMCAADLDAQGAAKRKPYQRRRTA